MKLLSRLFHYFFLYHCNINHPDKPYHRCSYPPAEYPVIALKGAPAPFPMLPSLWHLQKHLVFSDYIMRQANKYIEENFPYKSFIGIHLRNGADWVGFCFYQIQSIAV